MFQSKDSGFTLFGTRIQFNSDANFSDCSDDEVPKATIEDDPREEDAGKAGESSTIEDGNKTDKHADEEQIESGEKGRGGEKPEKIIPCPRCRSMDTKFCYFNNYNVNQPRHFCRNCQRYWTSGGAMRSVPVGAGRRKNKPSPVTITTCDDQPAVDNSVVVDHNNNNMVSVEEASTTSVSSMMTSELPGSRHVPHVPHHPVYCYPAGPWGFPGFYNPGSVPLQFVTGPYWGCIPFWPGGGGGAVPASTTASSSCCSGNTLGKHGREEDCAVAPKTVTVEEDVSASRTHNKRIQ